MLARFVEGCAGNTVKVIAKNRCKERVGCTIKGEEATQIQHTEELKLEYINQGQSRIPTVFQKQSNQGR